MAKYRFKLLAGRHNEGGKVYKQGDVIETDNDLSKLNNGGQKFERLERRGAPAETKQPVVESKRHRK